MGELKDNPFADDDILIEVLQRLPVKSLFDFKCVSKRWYDIISSHYFRKLYQSQRRGAQDDSLSSLLGFFRSAAEGAFIPTSLLVENPYRKSSSSSIDMVRYSERDGDFFIGSSNGLLLYHSQYFMAYRISNPVTKRCLFLAQPHSRHVDVAIGFDVKESYDQKCNLGQLKFKLVCLVFPSSTTTPFFTLQTKTYSSETRCWRQRNLRVSHGSISIRCFEYAVVINEVFYWLDIMNRIFAYDSNGTQGWEERTIQVIESPKRSIATTERSFILGESKDGVLQCGRSDSFKIVVWVLKACMSDGGGDRYKWVFRETVSFMLMSHQYPVVMSSCDLILSLEDLRNERNASVPELVAFHPLNPGTVFLRLDKMIISYCLDNGKLKLVQLQGKNYKSGDRSSSSDQPWERSNSRLVPYFSPKWASFYL